MMATLSRRTRYVVLASGGVLAVGLCGGLAAYLNRGAVRGVAADAPAALAFVPADATAIAWADVRAVMASEFGERLRRAAASNGGGRERLERRLGLDVERDVDGVLAFWAPADPAPADPADGDGASALALFAGRFDAARIEAAARAAGAVPREEDGVRIVGPGVDDAGSLAMAFLEPGLAAVGELDAVRRAAARAAGEADAVQDAAMMRLLGRIDPRSSVWAVGRFADGGFLGWVPETISERLPPVTAFAAQGRIDGGLGVSLTVEGRDDEAAQNLRDVVRGVVALAQLQSLGVPELQAVLDSLETGGTGTAVTLSFHLPAEALDLLLALADPS